jgi:hypothetical protein
MASAAGRGRVVFQPHTALDGDHDGTGVDNAASSASGGAGDLEVSAYSGFTSVAVKFQDSADNVLRRPLGGGVYVGDERRLARSGLR